MCYLDLITAVILDRVFEEVICFARSVCLELDAFPALTNAIYLRYQAMLFIAYIWKLNLNSFTKVIFI